MPWDRSKYGPEWGDLRKQILERAAHRCECRGECGAHGETCGALNHQPHPETGSSVVLTIAHLDHDPAPGQHNPERLRAMCQKCHNTYDRPHRARNARSTRERKFLLKQPRLPGVVDD